MPSTIKNLAEIGGGIVLVGEADTIVEEVSEMSGLSASSESAKELIEAGENLIGAVQGITPTVASAATVLEGFKLMGAGLEDWL